MVWREILSLLSAWTWDGAASKELSRKSWAEGGFADEFDFLSDQVMSKHRRAGLARGAVMPRGGWLREVRRWACCALRRTGGPSPGLWGVSIIAVHRAFVLGLGAQHRGIVKLSEGG